MTELIVRVTFLNPFRIVPWDKRERRKTNRVHMRGGTFAKWHKAYGSFGRPYITGTLLRSALFRELEKIQACSDDYNPFGCCSGKEKTDSDIDRPDFLRRRPRWLNERTCDTSNRPVPCVSSRESMTRSDEGKKYAERIWKNGLLIFPTCLRKHTPMANAPFSTGMRLPISGSSTG